jgi:hypothetical protein
MGYNVAALADYTRQNANELVMASHFDAKTQQLIMSEGNVMTKVKSAQTINILSNTPFFQSDTTCGFNASGTTTFTQRVVTVGPWKVQEQYCEKDLNAKYTQEALKAGSSNEDLPFEQQITEEIAGGIAEALEVAIWQADTAGSAGTNGLMNKFDGILKLLNAASGTVVQANASGYLGIPAITGAITTTNIKNIVDAAWFALPAKVQGKSDVRIFVGYDFYNTYLQAYRDQNLFNFAPTNTSEKAYGGEVVIPGTNYRLTPVHGLDGTRRVVALRMSNLFMGVDLEGEENDFKIWYSLDDMVNKLHAAGKTGINFAFPGEIVNFII